MAVKLFVSGLPYDIASERVREVFASAGTVESVQLLADKLTGRSRGFGFVEMASAQDAEAAITRLNGSELEGRRLAVALAQPPAYGGGRSGPGL